MNQHPVSSLMPWRTLTVRHVLPALLLMLTLTLPQLRAQATGGGTVTGFVSNSATRQFLGEAEVRIPAKNISVLTNRDGSFAIPNLAPGTYELEVSYTGLDTEKRSIVVEAGKSKTEEFNLTSGIYKMSAFVVASEVEGNAAEINKVKKADFFMQSISADTLGTVPDGNIGEFLRYVPGLQVNYSNADANTVSMRGQDADATLFTFDGQTPAAAGTPPRSSTGSSDASSRAFEFSSTTINNIESIEIYKAPPPWMAPATGGVINAVTKNAFSQKGRVFRTSFTFTANSEMLRFEIDGPGRRATNRIKPGGSFNYSEAFLNNRLGISLSYQETNSINPTHNYAMGYSPFTAGSVTPVTATTPINVNTFTLVDGPQVKQRRNVGLNTDYKLTRNTVLKFGLSYNYYLSQNRGHTFRIKPNATTGSGPSAPGAGTIAAGATSTDVTLVNAAVDVFDDYSDQLSQAYGAVGSVEHKWGPWKINYSGSYSKSDAKVADLPEMIQSIQYNLLAADGVVVRMTADPSVPAPITLVQTAGPDLYDLRSYSSARSLSLQTSPRFQNDRTMNLKFDLTRSFANARFPFDVRAGGSLYQLHRRKLAGQIVLQYVGPDGVANTADDPPLNASLFEDTTYGDKFLYGIKRPPLLDPYKFADFMRANPGAVQDLQGTNIQRQAVNSQNYAQDVTAGYIASTVKATPKLTFMTGVRWEKTENFVRGAIRINSLGVGLPANSKAFFSAIYSRTQRATTSYTDYFPNFQTTYRFSPNFILRGSLTRSLKRPDIQTILPNTTVNDTAAIPSVTVNNTGLLPSFSRNLDFQLEYYTRPAGTITLGWFKKTVTNYIINEVTTVPSGPDNGFDGQYANYLLNTQDNGGKGQFEGLEASVRQGLQPYLKFLPEYARGFEVFGSYTHFYKAEAPNRARVLILPLAPGFNKDNTSVGVSYQTPARMLYLNVRTSFVPGAVTALPSATDLRPVYEARHQRWDATLRWRINREYSVEFVGANLTDDSFRETYQGGRITSRRSFGKSFLLTFSANLDQLKLPFIDRDR